jgi:hypothetical protein
MTLKLRGDTAAAWTAANPTLAAREMAVETDTRRIKIGDGSTAWTALPYAATGAPGADGDDGAPGPGLPAGGATGDFIRKASDTDYATEFRSPSQVLGDIGAAALSTSVLVFDADGDNAAARPTGAAVVMWLGVTAEPTNAAAADLWFEAD